MKFIFASILTILVATHSQSAQSADNERLCGWVAKGSTETIGVFAKYDKNANLSAWCKSNVNGLKTIADRVGLPAGASGWEKKVNYKCKGINKNYFGKDRLCARIAKTGEKTQSKIHVIKFSGGKIKSVNRF